jgi:hypothetical protein
MTQLPHLIEMLDDTSSLYLFNYVDNLKTTASASRQQIIFRCGTVRHFHPIVILVGVPPSQAKQIDTLNIYWFF